jgi:hypothetical protein
VCADALALPTLAAGPVEVDPAFLFLGVTVGLVDVSISSQAVAIETGLGKTILPGCNPFTPALACAINTSEHRPGPPRLGTPPASTELCSDLIAP